MKIIIVHNSYRCPGGEEAVVEAERQLLKEHGNEVVVFGRDNSSITSSSIISALNAVWSRESYRELILLIDEFQPDIIHVHNTFHAISPSIYWAAFRKGVPVVQTLHNFRLGCLNGILLRSGTVCEDCVGKNPWRGVLRRCYRGGWGTSAVLYFTVVIHKVLGTYRRKITRYIALSDFSRKKCIEIGLPKELFTIKPNSVEDPGCSGNDNRTGGLFVGRISQEKGTDVLLGALSMLRNCKFTIVGDGPQKYLFERLGNVDLVGWKDKHIVFEYMGNAEYIVIPSICYENFPCTIIEAFSLGLPVIASRLGAMAEIIEDHQTGLLFNPGDKKDLFDKIKWAGDHHDEMLIMGKNARKTYEEKYSSVTNYDQLLEIYSDAIVSK